MAEPHLVHAVVDNSNKTLVNPGDSGSQALKALLVGSGGTPISGGSPLPVTTTQLPAALGQTTMAASASVTIASNQSNVPVISNNSEVCLQASFTRPADTTAYTAGDLVANNVTAGSVVPLTFTNAVRTAGDCVRIERVRVQKSGTSLTNATFRVHLFEASPTPTVGDNGAYNSSGVLSTNNVLNMAGTFPVTVMWSGSDGASGVGLPATGSGVTASPTTGTSLFAFLEVTGAYTPTSGETFYVTLEGYRP